MACNNNSISIPRESAHKEDESSCNSSSDFSIVSEKSSSIGSLASSMRYQILPTEGSASKATNKACGRMGKCGGAKKTRTYHRKKLTLSSSVTSHLPVYADNEQNRRFGRVGKVRGTHVIHSSGSVTVVTPPSPAVLKEYIGKPPRKKKKARSCSGHCKYNQHLNRLKRKVKEACLQDQHLMNSLGNIY